MLNQYFRSSQRSTQSALINSACDWVKCQLTWQSIVKLNGLNKQKRHNFFHFCWLVSYNCLVISNQSLLLSTKTKQSEARVLRLPKVEMINLNYLYILSQEANVPHIIMQKHASILRPFVHNSAKRRVSEWVTLIEHLVKWIK